MSLVEELRDFDGVTRLFPLAGVVFFPHTILPLHIFEPRYRQMTEHALAGDRLITIVQPRRDPTAVPGHPPPLEQFACLGKIKNCERLADGRFNFLLLGLRRVRLDRELVVPTLYRQAEVTLLIDIEPTEATAATDRKRLVGLFREFARRHGMLDRDLDRLLDADAPLGILTDIIAHAIPLPPPVKQAFLAETRVARRAEDLIGILSHALGTALAPDGGSHRFPPDFSRN